jgi:hypothetical protein
MFKEFLFLLLSFEILIVKGEKFKVDFTQSQFSASSGAIF